MNAAIKAIRAVGDLGGRKGVVIPNDVTQIVEQLTEEVHGAGGRLAASIDVKPDFKLQTMAAGE